MPGFNYKLIRSKRKTTAIEITKGCEIIVRAPLFQSQEVIENFIREKSVWIETPYLVLDEPFKQALITAAKSGIDVKIIIPGKPDKPFVYQSTLSYAEELFEYGVEIFIYEGFIHSKVLVVDEISQL